MKIKGYDLLKRVGEGELRGQKFSHSKFGTYKVDEDMFDRLALFGGEYDENVFSRRTPQQIREVLESEWEEVIEGISFQELCELVKSDGNYPDFIVVSDVMSTEKFVYLPSFIEQLGSDYTSQEIVEILSEAKFILD